MSTIKTIKLKEVRISDLRKVMSKSSDLKGGVLNFTIGESIIESVTSNESDSFFKKWSIPTEAVAKVEERFSEKVKVSIIKGTEFLKGILGHNNFGESCSIDIEHTGGANAEAVLLTIYNDKLQVKVVTAPTSLNFEEYDEKTMNRIFNDENSIADFELSAEELKYIISLSKFNTNKETQTTYIKFYTENGLLKVTDNAFDAVVHKTDSNFDVTVNVNKEFISLYCSEHHVFSVHSDESGGMKLIAKSTDSDTVSSMILMESSKADGGSNIENLSSEFNWDNDKLSEVL